MKCPNPECGYEGDDFLTEARGGVNDIGCPQCGCGFTIPSCYIYDEKAKRCVGELYQSDDWYARGCGECVWRLSRPGEYQKPFDSMSLDELIDAVEEKWPYPAYRWVLSRIGVGRYAIPGDEYEFSILTDDAPGEPPSMIVDTRGATRRAAVISALKSVMRLRFEKSDDVDVRFGDVSDFIVDQGPYEEES